jgi:hypothetical protein
MTSSTRSSQTGTDEVPATHLKYRPDFPDRFGGVEQARAFCQQFFAWYNDEHHHSGIAWHTPHIWTTRGCPGRPG